MALLSEVSSAAGPRDSHADSLTINTEFGTALAWHLCDLGSVTTTSLTGAPRAGKPGRSHPTDAEEFYRRARFQILEEFQAKLWAWEQNTITSARTSPSTGRFPSSGSVSSGSQPPV